jgi:hypothetical protein
MAAIQEYDAPGATSVIRPTEVGEQAVARAATMGERRASVVGDMYARSIGNAGRALGQGVKDVGEMVDQHMAMMDKSTQGPAGVALVNTLTTAYDAYMKTADPAEPGVYQKFYDEHVVPAVQKWQDGFRTSEGREWGQARADSYLEHMQNVVHTGAGEMSGVAVMKGMQDTVQQSSDLVANHPEALPIALDSVNQQWDNLLQNPNLTAVQRAKLNEERPKLVNQIGESAAYARMAANPSGFLNELKGGAFDHVLQDTGKWINLATNQAREAAQRAQADALRGMEIHRMQLEQRGQAALGGFLQNNTIMDPRTGLPTLGPDAGKNFMAAKQNMQPSQVAAAIGMMDRAYDRSVQPRDDPDTKQKLIVAAESGDPNLTHDVALATLGKNLTDRSAAELREISSSSSLRTLMQDPGVADSYRGAAEQVEKAVGDMSDPQTMIATGGTLISKAATASAVQAAKTAMLGELAKAPDRASAMKMLDPTSDTSLVSMQKIMYYRNMAVQLSLKMANPTLTTPPASAYKPGMSMSDLANQVNGGKFTLTPAVPMGQEDDQSQTPDFQVQQMKELTAGVKANGF